MPIVNPRSPHGMPHDWRAAWDAFNVLRKIGQTVGEPIGTWRLEYPGRGRKMLDKRWTITYTWNGVVHSDIFLGIGGKESREAINRIIPIYRDMAASKKAGKDKPKDKPTAANPMWDVVRNRRGRARWHSGVTDRNFFQDNPNLVRYANQPAGFLDRMKIWQYWNLGIAEMFPAPPRSKEEWDYMQREYHKRVEEDNAARKRMRESWAENDTPTYGQWNG